MAAASSRAGAKREFELRYLILPVYRRAFEGSA
jgi:hypothetical protein